MDGIVPKRFVAALIDWLLALAVPMYALGLLVASLWEDGSVAAAYYIATALIVLIYFGWGWRGGTLGMRALRMTPVARTGDAAGRGKATARGGIALVNAVAFLIAGLLLFSGTPSVGTALATALLLAGLIAVGLAFASMLTLAISGRSLYDRALGLTVERRPLERELGYGGLDTTNSAADTSTARVPGRLSRVAAFVGFAVLTFLVLGLAWFIFLLLATEGGECSFEEVECGQFREFVAHDAFVAVTLALIVAAALVFAWRAVRTQPPGRPRTAKALRERRPSPPRG